MLRITKLRLLSASVLLLAPLAASSDASAAPISPDKTYNIPPPDKPYKPPPPQYVPPPADGFHWQAEPRAEKWAAAWRPIKWPEVGKVTCVTEGASKVCRPTEQVYDPDYVHPKSFNILVSGCVTKADWEAGQANKPTTRTYTWTANGQTFSGKSCGRALTFPAQGTYPVTLTVDGKTYTQAVQVKDILIVALGDSMSSGEGAPDERQFVGEPYRAASWVDRQCHRSKFGPAAQAAVAIEKMDSRTSVTFLSFACSGATLDTDSTLDSSMWNGYVSSGSKMSGTGILGPYAGIEAPPGDKAMDIVEYREKGGFGIRKSQVEQMKEALGGRRRADAVVMSAGINDARFAAMMHTCALYTDCWAEKVGSAASKTELEKRFARDAGRIPDFYERLGKELSPLANRVMVFQYPNAFTGDDKKTCSETLHDVALSFMPKALRLGIDPKEAKWIQTWAGPTLHNNIKAGTQLANFEFVEGPWEAFKGHGYCASMQNRWFNTAVDSNNKQGPSLGDTKGTIHPNANGYRELAQFIVKELTSRDANAKPRPLSDSYATTVGKVFKVDVMKGVLANDSDPDIISALTVKSFTQPSGKVSKVQVEPDGSFAYNPAGFVGTDSFFYTVTDGVSEAIGRVEIKVTGTAPSGSPPAINANVAPLKPKP